jgi:hypothetical protein
MKKVGFRRKLRINWDWENPLAIFFIIFTGIGIISALLVTAMSAWNTPAVLAPSIFGGMGVVFGFLGLTTSLTRDQ